MKFALWLVPPKLMVVPLTKFVPVIVSVEPEVPAILLEGERLLAIGTGLLTVNVSGGVDVPPPGAGFVTVTEIVPAVAISEDAIDAVTWVPPPLTVPLWLVPPKLMLAPFTN